MTTACIPHLMVDTRKHNKPVLLIDILPDLASAGAQWVRTTLSGAGYKAVQGCPFPRPLSLNLMS